MEKKALSNLAKMLLVGAGGVAVGGAAASIPAYRYGANKMGDVMAREFTTANIAENEGIVNRFNNMNAVENKQITEQAYRQGAIDLLNKLKYDSQPQVGDGTGPYGRGMGPGMGRADGTGLMKESSLDLEKIAEEAFYDELEKMGWGAGIKALAQTGYGVLKGSFKNLGKAGKSVISATKATTEGGAKGRLMRAGTLLRGSTAALGTIGAGVYGAKKLMD